MPRDKQSSPPSSFERRPRRSHRSTSRVSHYNVVGAHMYFFRPTKAYHAEVENRDTCPERSGSLSAATNVAS
ncbi:hypothetical protein EGR_07023 [Echinococcus granulosus]|uniref:Uncharacterized protein n=1 Tax=Echinococcus granulosus TaxID=6210 RepID=W6U9Q4_ECHGR|nr:hypothetical protein EGR_07023 [Echinococcus granulosus]EUB58103.1 hypothetical protein EGR_07023 [Echinococcus granulosus]